MRSFVRSLVPTATLVAALLVAAPLQAQSVEEDCRACLSGELAGLGQNAAAAAAIGALGGLALGSGPGAVCGAVLAASGVGITSLINVANKCVPICKRTADRAPASVPRCDEFRNKAAGQ